MDFSERQLKIVEIVKTNGPITSEDIANQLNVAKGTLRIDLALLTMTGVLDARQKVGYFYSGEASQSLLFKKIFHTTVEEIMAAPMLVRHDITVYDAIVTLFMYDVGSLAVTNEHDELAGVVSRKDLLRVAINNGQLNSTPVAVIMTRSPNVVTATKDMRVLDVGYLLLQHQIDSVPVVDETGAKVIGKVTKTTLMEYFIKLGLEVEKENS